MNKEVLLSRILKLIILLTLLSACGEPYRATLASKQNFTEQSESESNWFDENGQRQTVSQPNTDQVAISQYWSEIQNNPNRSEAINNMIAAFDLIAAPAENDRIQLTGRMVLGCNSALGFQKTVEALNMQPGLTIHYGRQGEFEMESQCTTERCDEMMVAIRKVAGANRGLLLIPLGVGGASDGQIVYVPRLITRTAYFGDFQFQHVGEFESENSCQVNTGSNSGSLGDVLRNRGIELLQDALEDRIGNFFGNLF